MPLNYRRIIVLLIFLAPIIVAAQQPASPSVLQQLGYPANAKLLIIHADDLGMAHSVNQATFEALEKGWITSSSIMVPCPWLEEVARWAKTHPQADLGIHLTLDSEWTSYRWRPIESADKVPSLLDAEGYFPNDPSLLVNADPTQVEAELRAQIDRARLLGINPTHLDSHMLALLSTPPFIRVYQNLSKEYDLPILLVSAGEFKTPDPMPANQIVVTQVITMDPGVKKQDWLNWYKSKLSNLQPGLYELVVHLAHDDEEMQGATSDHPDWGAAWRQADFETMGSAEFRKFLQDQKFVLVSWRELAQKFAKAQAAASH